MAKKGYIPVRLMAKGAHFFISWGFKRSGQEWRVLGSVGRNDDAFSEKGGGGGEELPRAVVPAPGHGRDSSSMDDREERNAL